MCGLEGARDLKTQVSGLRDLEGPARDSVGERGPVDELEDQRTRRLRGIRGRVFDSVDGGDVGMIQRGEDSRFALETSQPVWIGEEGCGQPLDRDLSAQSLVVGAVDLAHPARTEQAAYLYPLSSSISQAL